MGDHERGKLDDSGFHYDGCAGGPCGWRCGGNAALVHITGGNGVIGRDQRHQLPPPRAAGG